MARKLPPVTGTVKRVKIQLGKIKRSLLLAAPPYPRVGDMLTISGQDWPVVSIKDEKVIAAFDIEGKRLRQVFP